ncbi:unnamed protein product [Paramecium primaurelia]|uniref:Uncharacterized protein n=1 Tax=Paramecium primaurelia TaxID=5886 RepID=A0A8S1M3G0_PARPR|nr:unnamed protein product [Paramecium primaurelia]
MLRRQLKFGVISLTNLCMRAYLNIMIVKKIIRLRFLFEFLGGNYVLYSIPNIIIIGQNAYNLKGTPNWKAAEVIKQFETGRQ